MWQISEFLPVFGFILYLGLFGYGLKKVLIKVENDKSKKQLNYQIIQKNNKEFYIKNYQVKLKKLLILIMK